MIRACALSTFGMLLAGVLAGCGSDRPILHVYTWADYIKPELIQRFEREHECRVVLDFFDSNEVMFAKLKAGASGYDLIFPSSYMVHVMWEQGMIRPVEAARIPNLRQIDRSYLRFTMDPEMHHSVPYMLSNSGIGYLKSRVVDFQPSWAMFDLPAYSGRMTLLNDMRETMGAALKWLSYSLNTTDPEEIAQARDVVIRWKKNIAKFESEQYKNGLVSAEFLLVHGYNGDILQVIEENDDIAYSIPVEGTSIASDDMVIPKDARNPDLAHAFMNFLHDPEVAAENTEFVAFLCPNMGSYERLDRQILEDPAVFLQPDLLEKCEVIKDLGEDNSLYVAAWDAIKAAE
ncbi:spermidine/putrescine ABC transporter substrate-binding protein [Candidatus Fermentibacteria bacterium]|nr:spermidine/putrescine ABC transporter substrate-binding protein [Candidatus Fermentibacteria bacterium]